jgi:hypothetical protein
MKRLDEITKSSIEQNIKILVSCLPLFAFWFIALGTSLFRLRAGLYIGAVLLIVMALSKLTRGTLLWAIAAFFALGLVAVWLPNMWIIRHLGVFPSGILFAATLLSMIVDRPFVQEYARVGAEQRASASFARNCFVLTSFWAATFLVMALVNVAAWSYPGPGRITYLFIQIGILVLALIYNSAYSIRIKRRRLAGQGAASPPGPPPPPPLARARARSARKLRAGRARRGLWPGAGTG